MKFRNLHLLALLSILPLPALLQSGSQAVQAASPSQGAAASQYVEVQLAVYGRGNPEELSWLATACLQDYPASAATAQEGCQSPQTHSNVTATGSDGVQGLQGNEPCAVVTLFIVAQDTAVTSASQDGALSSIISCIQGDSNSRQVVELGLSGISFADHLPRSQNSATFEYLGDWQQCSASCGGGQQQRALVCFDQDGLYATQLPQCHGFPAVTQTRECNMASCDSGALWTYGPWQPCSHRCGGGVSTRTAQCLQTFDTLEESASPPCSLEPPGPLHQQCNVQPCELFTWQIGTWSNCSASCGGGSTSREVNCTDGDGKLVDTSLCEANAPASTMPCNLQSCDFCSAQECSSRGTCLLGFCNCNAASYGQTCEIPLLSCESGVGDAYGDCCPSGVLNVQAQCCPAGSIVDYQGQCCGAGSLDACGVCGGNATTVDVQGACCDAVLDAQGTCCSEGLDECGVCRGVGDSCAITAEFSVSLVAKTTSIEKAALLADFNEVLSATVATCMAVPAADVSVTTPLPAESGNTTLVTISTAWIFPAATLQSPLPFSAPSAQSLLASTNGSWWLQGELSTGSVELKQVWRSDICGNGVCEIGERNWLGTDVTACPQDCSFDFVPCPPVNGTPCGGKGRCFTASGMCDCFAGYAGANCSTCAPGWASAGNGSCVPYAPDLLLLTPKLAARPPPPSSPLHPTTPGVPPAPPPAVSPVAGAQAAGKAGSMSLRPAPNSTPQVSIPDNSPAVLHRPPPSNAAIFGQNEATGTTQQPQQAAVIVGRKLLACTPRMDSGSPLPSLTGFVTEAPTGSAVSPSGALRPAAQPQGLLTTLSAGSTPPGATAKEDSSFFVSNVGGTIGVMVALVLAMAFIAGLLIWLVRQKLFRHLTPSLADAHKSGSHGAGSKTSSPGTSKHSTSDSDRPDSSIGIISNAGGAMPSASHNRVQQLSAEAGLFPLEELPGDGSLRESLASPALSTPPSAKGSSLHDWFESPAASALDSAGSSPSVYASPASPEDGPLPPAKRLASRRTVPRLDLSKLSGPPPRQRRLPKENVPAPDASTGCKRGSGAVLQTTASPQTPVREVLADVQPNTGLTWDSVSWTPGRTVEIIARLRSAQVVSDGGGLPDMVMCDSPSGDIIMQPGNSLAFRAMGEALRF